MSFPKYDDYKDSGIEWLGDIPEHWKVGKSGYYVSILSGYAFPSSGFSSDDSDTKLLREINVGVSVIRWDETVYWKRDIDDELDRFELSEGDLVIGMDRPWIGAGVRVAKINKVDLPCLLLQRVASITTETGLNPNYFLRLLSSDMFVAYFEPETTGVSVPHISPDQIENFIIPLPDEDEQQAISSFLDVETSKIDGLVLEQRRLIQLLKEKRQAVISHAVTKGLNPNAPLKPSGIQWLGDVPEHWELKPLKYIGQIISGFAFKSHAFTDAGVRVLKIANIQTFNLDWSDESFVPESFYAQHRGFAVLDGDIVFALTRPIISSGLKAAIADVGDELVLLNQRNAIFRPTNSLDKHFFYHVLFSESFRIDFENNIDFTGQQPNISPLDIADIKIPFPPKDEQETIGAYLDDEVETFSQLQAEAERAIELLQERRTALISAAVTGKIDVREFASCERHGASRRPVRTTVPEAGQ